MSTTPFDASRDGASTAGSSAEQLETRLQFLNLTESDRERMRQLAPRYAACADEFVADFYRHLFRFDETARFLQDPQLVSRLKKAQSDHFRTMLEANWSAEYVEQRRQIGHVHAEVGIEPEWFIGGYNQYVQYCFRRFVDDARDGRALNDLVLDQLMSVAKAIFLDIGLTLDAYFAQSTQKLRHALDMLWKANLELKHFAQLASHDLKTPLATVANLCDEALDEFGSEMPAGARELVDAAKNRTYRMSQMIDELLASNLAEMGDEANSAIASEPAILEAVERVRPTIQKRRIELALPKTFPTVWGNRVRLREAFYNLLSNATKFVDEGTGQIVVSVQLHADGHLFTVEDNGPGIPPEELERVFLPFRRLQRHRELPGSGLGLYFAKNMIEHQEGRLWAESKVGHGSRFCLLLQHPHES